jgi:hypothetical protein
MVAATTQACCLLATGESFVQTREKIRHLIGQDVSATTIEHVVEQVGPVAANRRDHLPPEISQDNAKSAPDRLYVVADGTTVHEKDGWHEAKAGCVYWDDKRFVRRKRNVYVI